MPLQLLVIFFLPRVSRRNVAGLINKAKKFSCARDESSNTIVLEKLQLFFTCIFYIDKNQVYLCQTRYVVH